MQSMQIYLNGDIKEVPEHCTLQELLEILNLKAERLAVELNREIVGYVITARVCYERLASETGECRCVAWKGLSEFG